jgi:sugar phosphate permease
MSLIKELWQFYLIYGFLVAAGTSGFWAPPVATVSRWFVKRRGIMTGIVSGGISFGTLVLPPLVAQLITAVDWRATYIIIGAAVLVIDLVVLWFFRSDPQKMGLLPLGASIAEVKPHLLTGFSIAQAMKTRQFWLVCLIYLCFGLFQTAVVVHIVPYAQDIYISAIGAAGILSILGGVSLAARIIMGALVDKLKVRIITILSLTILAAALIWLQFADSLWKLYLFAGILGFGYGGLSCLQALIAAELFGLISMGAITAFFSFSYDIGGAVGPVMAGYLFDAGGSYRWAFLVCALAAVIALIISLSVHPPDRSSSNKP